MSHAAPSLRTAANADAQVVYELVQKTIRTVYPDSYEPAIVTWFCRLHSREGIAADIEHGKVRVLEQDGHIVATGTLDGEHLTRVFVLPELRGQGLGTCIMDALEAEAAQVSEAAILDSSAPAEPFYLHRGYAIIDQGSWHIEAADGLPEATLVYKIMSKPLR